VKVSLKTLGVRALAYFMLAGLALAQTTEVNYSALAGQISGVGLVIVAIAAILLSLVSTIITLAIVRWIISFLNRMLGIFDSLFKFS